MRFDSRAVQSAMDPRRPNHLVLSYTRFMMGFLLFHPQPRDILIVGLGGGSLPKYCYHHLPDCRVTSVEINAKVIALRETFALPADDDRFEVVHADAVDYLTESVAEFDAILLDGFDADGIPTSLSSSHFYRHCRRALRKGGVLAANFSSADWIVATCAYRLCRIFHGQAVHARPVRGFNVVLYALTGAMLPTAAALVERARFLEASHDIDFSLIANRIRREEWMDSKS